MIKHIDYYTIACDQCGQMFSTEEFLCWPDVSTAEMEAEDWNWEQIDNKHVCPDCYERDADGELILKAKEGEK